MKKTFLPLAMLIVGTLASNAQNITLDATFNVGVGPDDEVYSVALQNDGKVVVGGDFNEYNGAFQPLGAVRLNADGTLENNFSSSDVVGPVNKVLIQNDGKILLLGARRNQFPINNQGIVRLNADGTLDTGFDLQGAGFDQSVENGIIQPDGKILLVGDFSQLNGVGAQPGLGRGIARLNTDGSLDATFNPGGGFSLTTESIALQADGKILVGGDFESFNGVERNYLARLNADGTLDTGFDSGDEFTDDVRSIAVQPDGQILVGGNLIENFPFGVTRPRILRLNTDGTVDNTFDPGTGFSSYPYAYHFQPDGKILVAGDFGTFNGSTAGGLARLNADGSLDATFNTGLGFQVGANPLVGFVNDMAIQPDGKILVVGGYSLYDGTAVNRIARLLGDGQLISVQDLDEDQNLLVYPNPANTTVTLNLPTGAANIRIIDSKGALVLDRAYTGNAPFDLDVSAFHDGVYLLVVEQGGQRLTSKLMVQH